MTKKKATFKILSKRAFAVAMSVAVLGSSATLLTGCGSDGVNGKSAYELAVEGGYTGALEEWLESLKGANGSDGTDGIDSYIGYDGYIWKGKDRTNSSIAQTKTSESVVENTMAITETMAKYFEGSYLDLSTSKIALMANYMPNAKVTRYSGLTIKTIKVVAEKSGKLNIGIAKVADIVKSRTNGSDYLMTMTEYSVVKGVNNLTINLEVDDDETIVLGGGNSVGLYVAKGIPVEDEVGNFAMLDGNAHSDILSKSGTYADTLAIESTADFTKEAKVFNDVLTDCPQSAIDNLTAVKLQYSPFAYTDTTYYAGKTLAQIGMPIKQVSTIDENQTFTMFRIKQTTTSSFASNYVEKYTLTLPVEALQGATFNGTNYDVNKWVYIDLSDLNIKLGNDESLAFSSSDDTAIWGYSTSTAVNEYNFYNSSGSKNNSSIYFDISYIETATIDEHIAKLEALEQQVQAN